MITSSMPMMIERAKAMVVLAYEHRNITDRPWLEMHVDSYDNPSNRIQFFVLHGSPVKGIVIANYGFETVIAIDCWGKKLRTFSTWDAIKEPVKCFV